MSAAHFDFASPGSAPVPDSWQALGLHHPTPDSNPVVTTTDLTKVYGRGDTAVTALHGINVAIGRGKLTAIMGPSGSGKSTLMHCLAGLDRATSGTIMLGETEVTRLSQRKLTRLRRDRIGFVFQSFNLLPTLSAAENITLPADIGRRKLDQQRLETVIDAVGLRDRLKHLPAELSGGQQQRVAVARALVGNPEVVFADEPTGNLDSAASVQVLNYLRKMVDEFGQSVVMVTHEPSAAAYADLVLFLVDGQVVAQLDSPDETRVLGALGILRDRGEAKLNCEQPASKSTRSTGLPKGVDNGASVATDCATDIEAAAVTSPEVPPQAAMKEPQSATPAARISTTSPKFDPDHPLRRRRGRHRKDR